jgi:hypothetical protein
VTAAELLVPLGFPWYMSGMGRNACWAAALAVAGAVAGSLVLPQVTLAADVMAAGEVLIDNGTPVNGSVGPSLLANDGLIIGLIRSGSVVASNGGTVTSTGPVVLGLGSAGHGVFVADGFGSTLQVNSGVGFDLVVGERGAGTLRLINGGFAQADASLRAGALDNGVGRVEIDGLGSGVQANNVRLADGQNAVASLALTDGGRLTTGRITTADGSGSAASILVDGPGSFLGTDLLVPSVGRLDVRVCNGGAFVITNGVDSLGFGSSLETWTIEGAGSRVRVGSFATNGGDVRIADGGTLDADSIFGGHFTLDGGSIATDIFDVRSLAGHGTVTGGMNTRDVAVGPGQILRVSGNGQTHTLDGTLDLDGGTFDLAGDVLRFDGPNTNNLPPAIVGRDATVRAGVVDLIDAQAAFTAGRNVIDAQLFQGPSSFVSVSGGADLVATRGGVLAGEIRTATASTTTLLGPFDVNGASFTGTGEVITGGGTFQAVAAAFAGGLTVGDDTTLGLALGQTLEVAGTLTLDGTADLAAAVVGPLPGDEYVVAAAGEVVGVFDRVDDDLNLLGLELAVAYEADAVVIRPLRLQMGDANFDGQVNLADFGILRGDFGDEGRSAADFNLDGKIDLADFGLLRANFGDSLFGTAATGDGDVATMDLWAGTVPEPATLSLLTAGALSLLRRRTN